MIARTFKITGLAALSTGLALALVAQTPPPPALSTAALTSPMATCRADVKALCATVERGKGAKVQCLVENRAKASPECQAAMVAIQERMAKKGEKRRLADCRADVATLCATAAKGTERVQCLRQNEAKVSPACSQALAAMPVRKRDTALAPAAPSNPPPNVPDAPEAPKQQ